MSMEQLCKLLSLGYLVKADEGGCQDESACAGNERKMVVAASPETAGRPLYSVNKSSAGFDYAYPLPDGTMILPKGQEPVAGKSFWEDAGLVAGGWRVRGPTYDEDRVKIPCPQGQFLILALDWHYSPKQPVEHVCSQPGMFVDKYHRGRGDRPLLLVFNFMIPGQGNLFIYMARNPELEGDTVFEEQLECFLNHEDDNYRNERLKIIPGLLKGPYLAKKMVGNTPALLAKKIATKYHRGDNYFEIQIDIGSSKMGSSIFQTVKGYASNVAVHLAFVIESKERKYMPERLLCGFDITYAAMKPPKSIR